jgi:phosphoesterase RecJ-like protein
MTTTDHPKNSAAIVARIAGEIAARQRFLLTSHVRPDGDSIGSQLALARALEALGKDVRIVNRDQAPPPLRHIPGVEGIEVAASVEGDYDALVVLECGDLERTGLAGLDRYFTINVDHHPGNAMFGAVNWFDPAAAACGEMVFDIIAALGVPLSREMATDVYVAILTDTGSFHYSNISPRTFDICRQALEAGADPVSIARTVFDSNSIGRLRLFGSVLTSIDVDPSGRLVTIYMDRAMERATGGSYDDTEGLINLPLTVREVQAVAFLKEWDGGEYRVSLRSKGDIDVCRVAKEFGGGGHKNASGCTVPGPYEQARATITDRLLRAMDRAATGGAGEPCGEEGVA